LHDSSITLGLPVTDVIVNDKFIPRELDGMSIGMFRQPTIAREALLAVALLLAFQIVFACLIVYLLHGVETQLAAERHRLAVISTSTRIANLTQKFGILLDFDLFADRRYSPSDTETMQSISARLENEFKRLSSLAQGDPMAAEILKTQEIIFRAAEDFHKKEGIQTSSTPSLGDIQINPLSLVLGREVSDRYQELLTHYKAASDKQPFYESNNLTIVKGILLSVLMLDVVFTLVVLARFFNRLKKRIAALSENVDRYINDEPLENFVSPNDELAKLEKLFREMIQTIDNSARYETTLVEGTSDVIFKLDAGGRIRDLNAAAINQWGYQPRELEGAPWQTVVSPESQNVLRDFLASLPRLEHSSAIEVAVKVSDGSLIVSRFSSYWSEADQSTFCFVSDIEAAKRTEEELKEKENDVRMLMRNLPIGLLVVDQVGAFISTNERMEQMLLAYGSSSGSSSDSSSGSTSERTVDAVFADSDVLLKARQTSPLRTRLGARSASANGLACELTVVDLGIANETLVVVEDISEKAKLENLRKDFLQLLWRNLGEPILQVKQMLAGIEVTTEKERGRVQKFELNANRLLRLLDELLRLEELGPGKLVGAMVPTKVSDLADSAIASLADYALNQGMNLEVDLIPQVVLADFERVVQVLINLISNAIKFSYKGGTILLQIRQVEDQVEFNVIDWGRGVPLAKQSQIFQTYGQASASDARTGTGLGLAICKSIIEAHGGTIGVESRARAENSVGTDQAQSEPQASGGSRFWFKLPCLEGASE
jgi:PAS domain S-box-containing protein